MRLWVWKLVEEGKEKERLWSSIHFVLCGLRLGFDGLAVYGRSGNYLSWWTVRASCSYLAILTSV